MSRLNYFEWMFHPIVSPGFLRRATRNSMREKW